MPVLALALAGCANDSEATLRAGVVDLIAAANSNDAAGVRTEAEDLLGVLREQRARGETTPERNAELNALVRAILDNADVLDVRPSPSPQAPSPSPSPSPEPPPEPSPEPEPSEEPEASPSPPPPIVDLSPVSSPAAQAPPSEQASPAAT